LKSCSWQYHRRQAYQVCIREGMYTFPRTHTYTHTRTHTNTHTHMHAHARARTHTHTCSANPQGRTTAGKPAIFTLTVQISPLYMDRGSCDFSCEAGTYRVYVITCSNRCALLQVLQQMSHITTTTKPPVPAQGCMCTDVQPCGCQIVMHMTMHVHAQEPRIHTHTLVQAHTFVYLGCAQTLTQVHHVHVCSRKKHMTMCMYARGRNT
jgi:hypothetical protein